MRATSPRVRFSPAPTGYLHVGGARTALFNWLFARSTGGKLLLRIEDTDAERSRPELIEAIYESLRWLDIDWDEEPVHQSDRADVHRAAAERLLESGHAYRCDCAPEDVKARSEARGGPPGYDGHCRDREVTTGPGVVVRFRIPHEGETAWDDIIRGRVAFEHRHLEDFVIVRSNGVPMFHVANAVDDVDMGITHVIRGEDLLNVTPKVLLIREALGVTDRPVFAHLPLLVNEKRQKLSKRRDDVDVGEYRRRGFLAEAMANYLALLGWGPPDGVEVRPVAEIVELFRLDDVNKAPAFFDVQKLTHVNKQWIQSLMPSEFLGRSRPFLEAHPWSAAATGPALGALVPLVQERVGTLDEVPGMLEFLFVDQLELDESDWAKAAKEPAGAMLDAVIEAYGSVDWDARAIEAATWAAAERLELGKRKAQAPIRVAVTGRAVGPPLFESLEALGRERAIERLRSARSRL